MYEPGPGILHMATKLAVTVSIHYRHLEAPGYQFSCDISNDSIIRARGRNCGVLAIIHTKQLGNTCIEPERGRDRRTFQPGLLEFAAIEEVAMQIECNPQ
jgi:hypothetical protein